MTNYQYTITIKQKLKIKKILKIEGHQTKQIKI